METDFIKSKNKVIMIIIGLLLLAGCESEKITYISLNTKSALQVNQKLATAEQPSQFYLCNSENDSCNKFTDKWSGVVSKHIKTPRKYLIPEKKQKSKTKITFKKSMEKLNESVIANQCHCASK